MVAAEIKREPFHAAQNMTLEQKVFLFWEIIVDKMIISNCCILILWWQSGFGRSCRLAFAYGMQSGYETNKSEVKVAVCRCKSVCLWNTAFPISCTLKQRLLLNCLVVQNIKCFNLKSIFRECYVWTSMKEDIRCTFTAVCLTNVTLLAPGLSKARPISKY